ncbi:MAG: FAD-dependent oxidoreductase [Actinomycetota bacterium]
MVASGEQFDVIIVGAGPAGLSAAYTGAKAGLKVIVFERGEFPGSKNMMGGIFYRHAMDEIIPEFWKEAPLERPIVEYRYWLLSKDSGSSFSFRSKDFGKEPYNGFSILRAKFDRWFAEKVVEAGALLVPETLVEKLIKKDDAVVGVQTGRAEGDVYAPVVIIADGANSLLARDAGIHAEWRGDQLGLGVKEIISLPKETIEGRFNLEGNEGVGIQLLGEITKGLTGGGFIYTNVDSLAIGVIALVGDIANNDICPNDLIEDMKNHPLIKPLIADGEVKEYSAHFVPEGGYRSIPTLYGDGWMLAGDAAMLVNTVRGEGANLAITSGKLAAETAIRAKDKGDFSKSSLSLYKKMLDESYVLKDLKKYKDFGRFLHSHPQITALYPQLLEDVARAEFAVDGIPKEVKGKQTRKKIREKTSLLKIARDLYGGWRALK